MRVNVYAIHDVKAGAFLQPWFAPTHAMAFRNIEKSMRTPNSPFSDFPADFTLFKVGEFEDDTGEISPVVPIESLGNFLQFVSSQVNSADTVAA